MRSAAPLAISLALFSGANAAADGALPKGGRVHFEGSVVRGLTLMIQGKDGAKPVLKLPPWVGPDDFSISPSGHHALIFAQMKKGESRLATVVDVSNAASAAVTGTFKPGVGGGWYWSPTDTLILEAGCGTNCAQVSVFDVRGKELAHVLCDGFGPKDLSRDHRYVACFAASSSGGGDVDVLDTTTGRVVGHAHVPCGGPGAPFTRDHVRFKSASLTFTCDDSTRTHEISRVVTWQRLP